MTRWGVKGARKSVQWTDVSPERAAPGQKPALLATDVARKVLAAILAHREVAPLLSDEHVPVDGTLVKAFAMGLEPMATPWLTLHEEFSAQTGGRPSRRR
jgi:ribosomal protein S4E